MKKFGVVVFTVTVVLCVGLFVMCAGTVYAGEKIAVVDVDNLFDNYNKTKDLNVKLESAVTDRQSERDALVEEIRRMRDEMVLVADQNKREKQDEIDAKIRELQKYDELTRDDLAEERNKYMREILVGLDKRVKEYGKKEGYDYIFNGRLLLYTKDKYDITEGLLKILNDEYAKESK